MNEININEFNMNELNRKVQANNDRQYVFTERAHFMCPNMNFGILITLNSNYNPDKMDKCLNTLADSHPFLRSHISKEDSTDRLYYDISNYSTIEHINIDPDQDIMNTYSQLNSKSWNVFEGGMLKAITRDNDKNFDILFISHHLLTDGRGLLNIVNEFCNLYASDIKPSVVNEHLIQDEKDLPSHSELTGISKWLIRRMNKKWSAKNCSVDYNDYQSFANDFIKNNPVSYEFRCIPKEDMQDLQKFCKMNSITITDYLMAKMMSAMKTNKIILAIDVRKHLSVYNEGACGNYSSAHSIIIKKKQKDIISTSQNIHKLINDLLNDNSKLMQVLSCYAQLNPKLLDACVISVLGNFNSKSAQFVGGAMFGFSKRNGISLTNLGQLNNSAIANACFLPPASPATKEILGVLTINGNMKLCCSFNNKSVTKQEVKSQLKDISSI